MATNIPSDTNPSPRDPSMFYQFYQDHIPIGRGGFGVVFQAVEKFTGRSVAIKRVRLKAGTQQDVLKELKILATSDHDHILRYYHSWSEPSEYHKGRDRILFDQSEISGSMMSTTGGHQTQSGDSALDVSRGPDDNRTQLGTTRWNTSSRPDDLDAIIAFESSQKDKSSSNNRSMPSTDDASSSNNRSIPSTDDVSSSEKEGQNKSEPYEYLFIVTSLCNPKSLADHLLPEYRSKNKITRFDALYIFYQIVEGVRYLHDNMNVIHCDLKPANILFSLDVANTVKIADFGLALTQKVLLPEDDDFNSKNIKNRGTKFYKSPSEEPFSFKKDIYALGIILFELLYPFEPDAEKDEVLKRLRQPSVEFPDDFEEKYGNKILKTLITQLLSHSRNERPTISNLKKLILRRLELDGSNENDDGIVSKVEYVLTNPSVKQISLATDEIQFGIFDTSDQYLLLSDDNRLKLYNINCQLIDEYSGLHESNQYVGYIQRIVWCERLRQFLILYRYFLYVFTPGAHPKLTNMKKVHNIDRYSEKKDLRFISWTNKYAFINYSYHTIIQYDIPQWSHSHEWSRMTLNYREVDEIRRTTCSTTDDYIVFNVRLNKCKSIVDIRRIDDNLTLLKRIERDFSIKQKLQLSAHEWLVSTDKHDFCVFNCFKEDPDLKVAQTNIKSESDIYPRFFGNYFLVPIIKIQQNNELDNERRGIIHFYQWK